MWRPFRRKVLTLVAILLFVLLLIWHNPTSSLDAASSVPPPNGFEPVTVGGFVNTGASHSQECGAIRHEGQISIEQSFLVDDDIQAIAAGLHDHPRIDYSSQDDSLSHEEVVAKTWARLAQSSVWLEQYQVYLTVTRTIFYDKGVLAWPCISFLRGQIHDASWRELRNHTIEWRDKTIKFPRTFDIPTPYTKDGAFYGPEDPRIIIEQGVPDAEPVIVFNMLDNVPTQDRSMFIFRPFSESTRQLSIPDKKEPVEKNWAPFFYRPGDTALSAHDPDDHIHFAYYLNPLKILKCRLADGQCDFLYRENERESKHEDTGGVMFGGTNLHAINLAGTLSYVGFPRTHVDRGCTNGFYRPALLLLSTSADNKFQVDFISEPLSFGDAAVNYTSVADPCTDGRILILNNIAHWDASPSRDTMTVSLSVDDHTTQVMRLKGIRRLLEGLPGVRTKTIGSSVSNLDMLECSIESAVDYGALQYGKSVAYRTRRGVKFREIE